MSRISKKKIEPVIQFVKKDNLNYMVYEAYEKRPNNIEYKYSVHLVDRKFFVVVTSLYSEFNKRSNYIDKNINSFDVIRRRNI